MLLAPSLTWRKRCQDRSGKHKGKPWSWQRKGNNKHTQSLWSYSPIAQPPGRTKKERKFFMNLLLPTHHFHYLLHSKEGERIGQLEDRTLDSRRQKPYTSPACTGTPVQAGPGIRKTPLCKVNAVDRLQLRYCYATRTPRVFLVTEAAQLNYLYTSHRIGRLVCTTQQCHSTMKSTALL